jgi:DNA-binding transcriptional ArsR family regulator
VSAPDPDPERATDEALRALAEPRRRAILRLVAHDELPAGRIAEEFEVSRTAVSQHLGVLKAAGLLHERREGTRRLYRIDPDGLAAIRDYFDVFWNEALAAFQAAAESEGSKQ